MADSAGEHPNQHPAAGKERGRRLSRPVSALEAAHGHAAATTGVARRVAPRPGQPNLPVTAPVVGAGKDISAAICAIDGGQPGSAVSSAGVKAAATGLDLHV